MGFLFRQTLKGIKVDVHELVYQHTHRVQCHRLKFRRFNKENQVWAESLRVGTLAALTQLEYRDSVLLVDSL